MPNEDVQTISLESLSNVSGGGWTDSAKSWAKEKFFGVHGPVGDQNPYRSDGGPQTKGVGTGKGSMY